MSISEAILASMSGDSAEAARQLNRVLLKQAVCHLIFCPQCGVVMDIRKAVLVTSKRGNTVVCADCYDRGQVALAAKYTPDQLARALASVEVADGRVLNGRKARKAKAVSGKADIRGTAVNTVTGEKRPVAMSERQVATLLNDEEHSTCAGECAHQIESDGVCPLGWPSQMRAVGMV
jgi:hypothetical protein